MAKGPAKFGDKVRYDIAGEHEGTGYVLGEMHYSPGNIFLVGTEQTVGMPVSDDWCEVTSSGHDEVCQRLRDRYLERFGQHWLKPR